MEFSQKIAEVATRSRTASKLALTEEATKTSVILPFLQALGYDVFNLEEVIPEYIADQGIKKGEKVDFLIRNGGKDSILVEAKPISSKLGDTQYNQLYRYFSVCSARLAILINGRDIWFFSDTDEKNKMDKKPFFTFDLQNYDERQLIELSRFQKSEFQLDEILEAASNMKYVKAAAQYLQQQLIEPEDDFVKILARAIYDGNLTKNVIETLRPSVKQALDEVIRNRIQEKLNVTFRQESTTREIETPEQEAQVKPEAEIITTEDELQAFMIIRAIGAKIMPVSRITLRDAKSYCSVFIDDVNRKPVCRLYFNGKSKRYIGIFNPEKNETKQEINEISDIFIYANDIEKTISAYL